MRKGSVLIVLLLVALLFSSCKAMMIEDMLVAPSFNEVQAAVVKVVSAVSSERVVYKYPVEGNWRAPIQFFDLDSDGIDEAIVFYSVQTESLNAFLAVLGQGTDGNWTILSTIEGPKTDVNRVEPIESGNVRNLLVEWSAGLTEKKVSVYNFVDGELREGLNEECSVILTQDLDGDGVTEFLYITAQKQGEPYRLKYVDNIGGDFVASSEVILEEGMQSYLNLYAASSADGSRLVYVDENLYENINATEVFELKDGALTKVDIGEDLDIFQISMRHAETPAVISRSFSAIGADVLIPSDVAPRETIADETLWKYWYAVEDGTLDHKFTSYVNTTFNFILGIPDHYEQQLSETDDLPEESGQSGQPGVADAPYNWLEQAVIIENEEEQRLFQIIDAETRDVIFELKVLRYDEVPSASSYEEEGFKSIQKNVSGAYRYYYRANEELCSPEDELFITENFYYGIAN